MTTHLRATCAPARGAPISSLGPASPPAIVLITLVACGLLACGGADQTPDTGGVPIAPVAARADQALAFDALKAESDAAGKLDGDGALMAYSSGRVTGLSYAPGDSQNLDLIQGSALALSDSELAVLEAQGLDLVAARVPDLSPRIGRHLLRASSPVLPADALLEAVHVAYDGILATLERQMLGSELTRLPSGMRHRLGGMEPFAAGLDGAAEVRADVDVYLAVAIAPEWARGGAGRWRRSRAGAGALRCRARGQWHRHRAVPGRGTNARLLPVHPARSLPG